MKPHPVTIGVLDIQGSVEEHLDAIQKLGVRSLAVKKPGQIAEIDGLIIPGGESTVIGKLMLKSGIFDAILAATAQKKPLPIWGTCAGAILLAKKIIQKDGGEKPRALGLMDITVERNAYGRQLESFEAPLTIRGLKKAFPGVFIRAPKMRPLPTGPMPMRPMPNEAVQSLASHNKEAVMLLEGCYLATSFHPELTNDLRVHRLFAHIVARN